MDRSARLWAAGLVLAALTPALTAAQGLGPHRRAGFWETRMTLPTGQVMATQMCTDESLEQRVSPLQPSQAGPSECSHGAVQPIPGGFRMESTCKIGGAVTTSHITATGDFQNTYRMDVVTDAGGRQRAMSMTMKWLGPCPAERKPGDMVMPGGMVVNIADAMARARSAAPP